MMFFAYLRDVKGQKELTTQKNSIVKYVEKHSLFVEEYLHIKPYSKRDVKQRRIDFLLTKASSGDTFIVIELSCMGRNTLEVLNLLLELHAKGIGVLFVKQPELNTTEDNTNVKSMLKVYSYFVDAERAFVSRRTKQGLAAVKAKGIKLGRPKGHKNKKRALDLHRLEIMSLLNLGVNLTAIRKIINEKLEKPLSYSSYKYFIDHDEELLHARHNYDKNSLFH